jgi:protein-disulfide isomerase
MRHIWWCAALALFAVVGLAQAAEHPTPAADDIAVGKDDAPITIYEYASLTCPHCAEFDTETFPKVKTDWIDTGKARLVFRNFPLDQFALKAAMVARCAPPERFFAFIDALFQDQANWAGSSNPDAVMQALARIARLGGISEDKFNACVNDKALSDRILNERLVANQQYGVGSTPTFFINGEKVEGALPYDQFAKALADAMPGAVASAAPPSSGPSTPAAPMPPSAAAAPTPPPAPQEQGWYQGAVKTMKSWYHTLLSYL